MHRKNISVCGHSLCQQADPHQVWVRKAVETGSCAKCSCPFSRLPSLHPSLLCLALAPIPCLSLGPCVSRLLALSPLASPLHPPWPIAFFFFKLLVASTFLFIITRLIYQTRAEDWSVAVTSRTQKNQCPQPGFLWGHCHQSD